jgi:hypothetical protein
MTRNTAGLAVALALAPSPAWAAPSQRDSNVPPVRVAAPVALNGRIDPAGDEDRSIVAVTPGQRLHIEVDAAENRSALDGFLRVLGANDAVLMTADDTPLPTQGKTTNQRTPPLASPDPSLDLRVPTGLTELTLALRDLESRGGTGFPYRITVTPITPSFEITLKEAQVSVPKNGSAAIGVTIKRKDYNGPITLSVANPPPGLLVRPGTVGEGQTAGTFTIASALDASFGAATLDVVGQGPGSGRADHPARDEVERLLDADRHAG